MQLKVSAPDFSFVCSVVRAIIVPELCVSVIFGNTFHYTNKLSISSETPAIIHKPTSRNLLLPTPPSTPTDTHTDHEQLRDQRLQRTLQQEEDLLNSDLIAAQYRDVVHELNLNFKTDVSPPMLEVLVGIIRQHIEEMALSDVLKCNEKKMQEEFVDCFPSDIPHINDLPSDTYHRFYLKDPDQVIQQCQYSCPKKY